MGKPLINIDWDEIEKLCKLDCNGEEISAFLGIGYNTLERACKRVHKMAIGDYIKEKRGAGNVSLRRRQYKAAMDGDRTMLIWLGKQRLGQSDKQVIDNRSSDGTMTPKPAIIYKKLTDEELLAIVHGQPENSGK
jgi:hypothetical protein